MNCSSCSCLFRLQCRPVDLIRGPVFKPLVPAPLIVEVKVGCQLPARLRHALVRLQIHLLVLDASPETFDEDVVHPAAASVHADRHAAGQQGVRGPTGRCPRRSRLIGVAQLSGPRARRAPSRAGLGASVEGGRMGLTWTEPGEIAWALIDAHPDTDPLDLNFVDLHRMIRALPDFDDDPDEASETRLEAVVMAWHEQR